MKKSKFIEKVLKNKDNTVFTTKEQVEVVIELFTKLGMTPPAYDSHKEGCCTVLFGWEEE